MWADDVTYTFTAKEWTSANGNWAGTAGSALDTKGVQCLKNTTYTVTSPSSLSNISSIVVTYGTAKSTTTSSTISIQVGDNSAVTKNVSGGSLSNATLTWTYSPNQSGSITMAVTAAGASVYIKSVAVTYSSGPSYTITAESNNTSWGTVSLSGNTIIASPVDGCTYADPAYEVTDGTATVSQSGNNFTVTPSTDCTVRINFAATPIDGVSLSPTSLSLSSESSTEQLTATVSPNDASFKTVTWTSSDESVATVTSEGVVNAVGSGSATITARATNGTDDTTDDYTATCTVSVSSVTYAVALADGTADASNWTISPSSATAGQTVTISYTGSRTISGVTAVKKPFGLSTFSFATPERDAHSDLAFTGASTAKPVWFTGTFDTHNTTGTVVYDHGKAGSYDLLSFNDIQFYEGSWDVPSALYITGGLGTKADPFVLSTTGSPASDMEITMTSAGDKTWTITLPTSDVEIQVAVPYTVTLGDDIEHPLKEATGGAGVTLPTRSNIGIYTFAGWSTTNVTTETTDEPVINAAGEYHPTGDISLYPVYTRTEGGGVQEYTSSVTMSEYATAHSWGSSSSSGQKTVTIDENVTATCNSGTNSGKYYSDWRIYQTETGSVTISTTSGELTSVTFTFTVDKTGTLNYNNSVVTSGTPVSVSGTSATFTVGNSGTATNGQVKITAISVNYTTGGGATTYYLSAPEAPAVEQPEITVAANPFLFSTTATITCDTEDATIKYSFDNETWNNYSSALTITSTTTLYAKAVKDANESTVASVAITKNLAEPTVTVSGDLTVDLNGETDVNAGTLTASVIYNESAVDGATVTWSSSDTDIATIDPSTGAVVIKTRGTVTFTATYAGNSDYAEATGTKEITVTDSKAPGTETRPYTVAEAIDATPASGTSANVYIQGYVSAFHNTSIVGDGSNYRYYISDDGTTTSQLLVYRGKKNSTDNFSDASDLEIGDKVTIYGGLTTYNSTKEVASGNYIVSRVEKPASDIAKTSDIALDVKNNALTANISDHISSSSDGAYTYESADPTVATVSAGGVVTGLKVGTTTITVNQAATLSYKAGSVEIPVTVADTREDATTIPGINISALTVGAADGTIEVVNPVKADEGVTFSFESSDEDVLLIVDDEYSVIGIGTATVTVTATASNSSLYKNVTETFEVTVNAAVKSENEIEIAFDSYSTEWGTNLEGLASGSTGFDGEITATSSNTNVLTVAVDAEGNVTVTPVAVGTATVTFSAAETPSFLAAEDVLQVFTVTAPEGKTTAPASDFSETFDFSKNGWGLPTSSTSLSGDYTKGGQTVTISGTGYYYGSKALLLGKSGAYVTLPAFSKPVTQIDVVGVDGASGSVKQNIFVGSNAVSTETIGANNVTNKYEIDSEHQAAGTIYTLKVTSAHNTQIASIVVHMNQATSATVTLNKYGFATYCSVNPMDFSSTEGYTAWRVSDVSGNGTITFEKITEAIKGGQGVLLYNKDADGESTSNVTVTFANGTTEFNSSQNKLFGTTAPTYVGANEYFGLSADHFVKVNAGTVKAGKALLPYFDKVSGIKTFTFIFNDSATGITESRTVSREVVETIFDLNGRRLSKPQRGINIVNGRKVVVK